MIPILARQKHFIGVLDVKQFDFPIQPRGHQNAFARVEARTSHDTLVFVPVVGVDQLLKLQRVTFEHGRSFAKDLGVGPQQFGDWVVEFIIAVTTHDVSQFVVFCIRC